MVGEEVHMTIVEVSCLTSRKLACLGETEISTAA